MEPAKVENTPFPGHDDLMEGMTLEEQNLESELAEYRIEKATSISACEDRFQGIIKWPSSGGTYEDFIEAVIDQRRDVSDSQMTTVGLKEKFDLTSSQCCLQEGEVTGLIHMVASIGGLQNEAEKIWANVVQLDDAGRKPGFYRLCVHCYWLNII